MTMGSSLLDVSCGSGELIKLCPKNISCMGVDISENALKRAKIDALPSSIFIQSEGEHLPLKSESFDYVSNIGSLEHFSNPLKGLSEMHRVLKKKGSAFILVPNLFALFPNIYQVLKSGRIPFDDQPIQRYASRDDWERIIEESGLKVYQSIKYERVFPVFLSDWLVLIRHPREFIHTLISPFIPKNLGWCFLFLCIKN